MWSKLNEKERKPLIYIEDFNGTSVNYVSRQLEHM
jgi:hypothetical protein